jgi:hypothetical protein
MKDLREARSEGLGDSVPCRQMTKAGRKAGSDALSLKPSGRCLGLALEQVGLAYCVISKVTRQHIPAPTQREASREGEQSQHNRAWVEGEINTFAGQIDRGLSLAAAALLPMRVATSGGRQWQPHAPPSSQVLHCKRHHLVRQLALRHVPPAAHTDVGRAAGVFVSAGLHTGARQQAKTHRHHIAGACCAC